MFFWILKSRPARFVTGRQIEGTGGLLTTHENHRCWTFKIGFYSALQHTLPARSAVRTFKIVWLRLAEYGSYRFWNRNLSPAASSSGTVNAKHCTPHGFESRKSILDFAKSTESYKTLARLNSGTPWPDMAFAVITRACKHNSKF